MKLVRQEWDGCYVVIEHQMVNTRWVRNLRRTPLDIFGVIVHPNYGPSVSVHPFYLVAAGDADET